MNRHLSDFEIPGFQLSARFIAPKEKNWNPTKIALSGYLEAPVFFVFIFRAFSRSAQKDFQARQRNTVET
jgi:hypothetical protein